mmetsp:Transcript_31551/g.50744  ORF Transcript_31551/g.50744 Transcript_31551/m.50744 type:complete len:349 (+) Transcript_31551:174-1220(+)
MIAQRLEEYLLSQSRHVDLPPLKLKVCHLYRWTGRLVLRAVELLHVRQLQRLLHRDSLLRVELQRAVQELADARGDHADGVAQRGTSRRVRQRLDEFSALLVLNPRQAFGIWRAKAGDDQLELMLRVLARQQRLAPQHLREDAADRPHVNGCAVVHPGAQHLWSPVPARADVLRHWRRAVHPGQPVVADLQVAVAVHQQVPRLEISMNNSRCVDEFQPTQDLVNKKLGVLLRERLRALQDRSQVGFHELGDHVNILETRLAPREKDIPNVYEVLVPQVAQNLELPQRPLRKSNVVEGTLNLLDRDSVVGKIILRGAHDTVGALAHSLLDGEASGHLEGTPQHRSDYQI